MTDELQQRVIRHEGIRTAMYKDSLGYWTIGVGRLIDPKKGGKLSIDECMHLLGNDLASSRSELSVFPWFRKLDQVRQDMLVEMNFNVGLSNLLEFKRMIAAISINDFETAKREFMDSLLAKQIGKDRLDDMAYRLRWGKYL